MAEDERPPSGERWFEPEELKQMSRPTMDRAIEAIDAGKLDEARALCDAMRGEWRYLHDLMVELIEGLATFIQDRFGEEQVAAAWTAAMDRGWRRDVGKILATDRRTIVESLAATWRAHSTSGVGPHAGAFEVTEDDEKFTFTLNPCGSCQRLWRRGFYQGPDAYGVTEEPHDWSFGRKGFPLYCTHTTFMNESLPIKWYGAPLYPVDCPNDFDHDPCVWYWYKDPADIPARHWERYGATKPTTFPHPGDGGNDG